MSESIKIQNNKDKAMESVCWQSVRENCMKSCVAFVYKALIFFYVFQEIKKYFKDIKKMV